MMAFSVIKECFMPTKIAAMLEGEEGRRRSAYQDSEGWWTIGIGRLIDSRMGGGLSDDEIDYLLANDIKRVTAEVRAALPWFDTLNEPRQAVLIGMAFQMGTGNAEKGTGLLGFKSTLAAMRDGRWYVAAAGMLASKWAKQTPKRAARMSRQTETGEWQ
jgi:lysozyme